MRLLVYLALILFPAASAFAQSPRHNFGLGVVISDPSGISAKYTVSRTNAIDAALAFGGEDNFYLHSSWLWLKPKLFNIDRFPVSWYYGIGGRIISHDHDHHHRHNNGRDNHETHFGGRAPVGMRMIFKDPRIELFGEVSVSLDIIPETDVELDLGIGARYYF